MSVRRVRDELGRLWDIDAQGNYRAVLPPAPPPVDTMKAAKAGADLTGANLGNAEAAATLPYAAPKAAAEARKAEIDAATAQREFERGPKKSDAQINAENEMRDRMSRLAQLASQIDRTEELFRQGPGETKFLGGIRDFLPTEENARFDTAGAALSQQGLAAFRVPGTGTVSDRDAIMFDRANLPDSWNLDGRNDEILSGLKRRINEELKALGRDPQWDETGNRISEEQRILNRERANFERDVADLPPQAQSIGRRQFLADPRIQRLMAAQKQKAAPRRAKSVDDEVAGYIAKARGQR